jgi:hypothetical protein
MVVRDVDRIDPRNQSFFNPDSDGSLWSTVNGNPVKNKYYDFQQTTTSAIVRGVRAACPPQQVGSGAPGTLNYAGGNDEWGKARLHLEVAQRFLNASDWEINTNPEYMCAVPRRATSSSQCYASGDADSSKYIRYTPVSSNAGDYGCGPGNAECAAYIHICYRTN